MFETLSFYNITWKKHIQNSMLKDPIQTQLSTT